MGFKEKEQKVKKTKEYASLSIKITLFLLVLLLFFEIYLIFSGNYNFKIFDISIANNYQIISIIELICSILVIILILIISHIYIGKIELIYMKEYLYSVDNDSILHLNLKDEITEGNLKTEGCKKIKNKYIIDLPKYKCTIKRFDEQELMGYSHVLKHRSAFMKYDGSGGPSLPDFKFFTLDSIVEYTFESLDKIEHYPFLYKYLSEKFYDVSILDNKIIIKYHLWNSSINTSNREYLDNFYNYDFTVNIFQKDDGDNIINIIEKAKTMYYEINNQIGIDEESIYGDKN